MFLLAYYPLTFISYEVFYIFYTIKNIFNFILWNIVTISIFLFMFSLKAAEHGRAPGRWIHCAFRTNTRGGWYAKAGIATLCDACVPVHHPSCTWSSLGIFFLKFSKFRFILIVRLLVDMRKDCFISLLDGSESIFGSSLGSWIFIKRVSFILVIKHLVKACM